MFDRNLLGVVRPRLSYEGGYSDEARFRSSSGKVYRMKKGYLDLLGRRLGAYSPANLANFPPGAGRGYEPLWRVHSLSWLTGEDFPNARELRVIFRLAGAERGGLFLDLGCSAGLYTRNLARRLGEGGSVIGTDISPSMLHEAAGRADRLGVTPSFVRCDAHELPFESGRFAGAVCGGSLNEFAHPAKVLEQTRRILSPGGRLAVMGILKASTKGGLRLQRLLAAGGLHFFERDEVTNLLKRAGFEPDPLEVVGPVFFAGASRRS